MAGRRPDREARLAAALRENLRRRKRQKAARTAAEPRCRPNRLYFGDCLDVIRENVADEDVDLIYLDPPFNSKRLYNAFIGGAQWIAFKDTWRWHEAVDDFHEVAGRVETAPVMEGLRRILGEGPALAYLAYMANRLAECRRVLKPAGSIYLHCDPTMSHYLKVLMDALFDRPNFRNEIVWKYGLGGSSRKCWSKKHDVVLFYTKGRDWHFDKPQEPATSDKMAGRLKGVTDVWDIPSINNRAKERVGYPTQKPLALLERIVKASSREGDVVLDPFCGGGTTLHAAQALRRRWIGIDMCVNACKVIERRLRGHFDRLWEDVAFLGMPKTAEDARTLAGQDASRFERWAAALVDGMEPNRRQRGDGGIDGRGRIAIRKGRFVDIVSQVKGGATGPGDVQAFNGARQQAGADMGVFICFAGRVTPRTRDAAASTGRFLDAPVVQIYTVEDYFEGRAPIMPKAT